MGVEVVPDIVACCRISSFSLRSFGNCLVDSPLPCAFRIPSPSSHLTGSQIRLFNMAYKGNCRRMTTCEFRRVDCRSKLFRLHLKFQPTLGKIKIPPLQHFLFLALEDPIYSRREQRATSPHHFPLMDSLISPSSQIIVACPWVATSTLGQCVTRDSHSFQLSSEQCHMHQTLN